MKPQETTDCATEKWLPYADKRGKQYEMDGKTTPIGQITKAEEAAAQDDKTCHKNDQNKSIKVNGNVK